MKKVIKTLQIGSFIGNVGDNFNHKGFKYLRDNFLDFEFLITEFEIRQIYRNELSFNSNQFINYANTFDLIVVGGGNFFELWPSYSTTGTSIDISINTLKKINCPILFYSLGLDLGQGYTKQNRDNFYMFIDYLNKNKSKYFISLRNDGSIKNFKKLFANKFKTPTLIPDSGFFYFNDTPYPVSNYINYQIVINLAGDMQNIRFNKLTSKNHISIKDFYNDFSKLLLKIFSFLNGKVTFSFVPHIYKDFEPIIKIINLLPDKIKREHIRITTYGSSNDEFENIYNIYKEADFIMANRFHSNVLSISLHKKFVGLINYHQVYNLLNEVKLDNYVFINKLGFEENIFNIFLKQFNKLDFTNKLKLVNRDLMKKSILGYKKINFWLGKLF